MVASASRQADSGGGLVGAGGAGGLRSVTVDVVIGDSL